MSNHDERINVDRYPLDGLLPRLARAAVEGGLVSQETLDAFRDEDTILSPAYFLGLGDIALVDNVESQIAA